MIEALKIWAGLTGEGAFSVGLLVAFAIAAIWHTAHRLCETVVDTARILRRN